MQESMNNIKESYLIAKAIYAKYGVNTDQAIDHLKKIKISLQCWQGDDVQGFLNDMDLSGGIAVTGNYPYQATTPEELRQDIEKALSLVPGKHKVNLHAIYLDTDEKVDLNQIEPKHFKKWVEWAKKNELGLDFNPTCFSHPMASTGFTLSSTNPEIRSFWIEHCKRSRQIGAYFGKELHQKSIVNLWIPDGFKDNPYDKLQPRTLLKNSLDQIYSEPMDHQLILDTLESKLFGIGSEAYTTGSSEFYLGYAVQNQKAVCLDAGHFHPTESIADKLSAISLFTKEMLLHVSRPVRWDSDHVVILDDELYKIAQELVRGNLLERTHIGLDYFDASINRIAAWVIGIRSMQKALLRALLEPHEVLRDIEQKLDYTTRLALTEELKTLPYGVVYDYLCETEHVHHGITWLDEIKSYEKTLEGRTKK